MYKRTPRKGGDASQNSPRLGSTTGAIPILRLGQDIAEEPKGVTRRMTPDIPDAADLRVSQKPVKTVGPILSDQHDNFASMLLRRMDRYAKETGEDDGRGSPDLQARDVDEDDLAQVNPRFSSRRGSAAGKRGVRDPRHWTLANESLNEEESKAAERERWADKKLDAHVRSPRDGVEHVAGGSPDPWKFLPRPSNQRHSNAAFLEPPIGMGLPTPGNAASGSAEAVSSGGFSRKHGKDVLQVIDSPGSYASSSRSSAVSDLPSVSALSSSNSRRQPYRENRGGCLSDLATVDKRKWILQRNSG